MNLDYLYQTVTDIERDLGMTLIASEDVEQDVVESPVAFNGERTFYASKNVMNITAKAHGFIWEHPYGATIRGTFAELVTIATSTLDDYGDEMDFRSSADSVARAILAKLGNIGGIDDVIKGMARA